MKQFSCLVFAMALAVSGCGGGNDGGGGSPTAPSANVPFSTTDLQVGTGTEATPGRAVAVNYTGWLYSTTSTDNKGTRFDSSLDPGRQPLVFTVGSNQVIAGFSQGVQGMRVGGTRRVVIPPNLGYGGQANGPIPANSTLLFEISLLAVQ
jgi:FKBP-type peptidyl-prolyl cis-trans isomerase FkpA